MIFLIFFLADFVVRIDYTIHRTEQLRAVYVIGMANGRLLLVKFWGSLKLHADFQLHEGGRYSYFLLFEGSEVCS